VWKHSMQVCGVGAGTQSSAVHTFAVSSRSPPNITPTPSGWQLAAEPPQPWAHGVAEQRALRRRMVTVSKTQSVDGVEAPWWWW